VQQAVLVLDGGSSRIRFTVVVRTEQGEVACALRGALTDLHGDARFRTRDGTGRVLADIDCADEVAPGHATALGFLFNWLRLRAADLSLQAVGHRLADDGGLFGGPVRVDATVLARLDALEIRDPHQRAGLAVVRLVDHARPMLPQIACFETSFYAGMSALAPMFDRLARGQASPAYRHGLAFEDAIACLATLDARAAGGRTIAVHLDRPAVLCAIAGGRSVAAAPASSRRMPAGGRWGRHGRTPRPDRPDVLRYRISREIGSLAAALGGIDAVVFAAERMGRGADAYRQILRDAAWLGIETPADVGAGPRLSRPRSPIAAWLIAVDPARVVARHTFDRSGI